MENDTKYPSLSGIRGPYDVKKLSYAEMQALAAEIRKKLIDTVSRNGGHLASNLGVVELTIALHVVFESPVDSIIWDVGHQCYTHKLLTGRFHDFDSIRQPGGLSGFPSPAESAHDPFYSGHASASVSAAYGIAQANKLQGRDGAYAVAVIGDGAFTGGLVYEALNNAGRERSNLIVILNDNEMSISENVGSFAQHLAVLKADPRYFNLKARAENALNRIPVVGEDLSEGLFKLKTAAKKAIYQQATLFEDLGFRYMGPLDGHNIPVLVNALRGAKGAHYPILLHVRTVKGKGYNYAELDPSVYHGISKFDPNTGEFNTPGVDFSRCFGETLIDLAEEDKRVCAITAAMSLGTGLERFRRKFPDRFFDVGIAEEHAVTFSAGLAKGGMLPVFAVYSAFLQRSYDQLVHDAALQNAHIVLLVDRAGFVSGDGETHHGLLDVPFFGTIPGVTVLSPATYRELKDALRIALYEMQGVVAIRVPKGDQDASLAALEQPYAPSSVYGDGESETAVVSYGRVAGNAYRAMEKLSEQGRKVKLVKLGQIQPIPAEAVDAAAGASRILFFEESERSGGVGERFLDALNTRGYRGAFELHAVDNQFVTHSIASQLLHDFGLDADAIAADVCSEVERG